MVYSTDHYHPLHLNNIWMQLWHSYHREYRVYNKFVGLMNIDHFRSIHPYMLVPSSNVQNYTRQHHRLYTRDPSDFHLPRRRHRIHYTLIQCIPRHTCMIEHHQMLTQLTLCRRSNTYYMRCFRSRHSLQSNCMFWHHQMLKHLPLYCSRDRQHTRCFRSTRRLPHKCTFWHYQML